MLKSLKQRVCAANRDLVAAGLVTLTWGNASGIDRERGLVVIKPSGVPYDDLRPQQMVVVDLEGRPVEGDLRPSNDTPTHVALYRASRTSAASSIRTAAAPRSSPRRGTRYPASARRTPTISTARCPLRGR